MYMWCLSLLPLFCREMAVKFNDYFEFPREFDMAPYTAAHLAKHEGGPRTSATESVGVMAVQPRHVACSVGQCYAV